MECNQWQICHLCSMAVSKRPDRWDCGLFKLFLCHAKPGFNFWDREGEVHSSLVSHLALGVSPLWGHAGMGTGYKTALALIEVLWSPQCLIRGSWVHLQKWATLQIWDWKVIFPSHIIRCFTFTWCAFQSAPWNHLGNLWLVWELWQCLGAFCHGFQPYLQLNVGGFCDDGKMMSSGSLPGEAHVNQDIPSAGRSLRVKFTLGRGLDVRSWRMVFIWDSHTPWPLPKAWLLQPRDYLASTDLVIKEIFLPFIVLGWNIKVQWSIKKARRPWETAKRVFYFLGFHSWRIFFFLANKIMLRFDSCFFFNSSEVCSVILLVWHPNSKWNT